MTETGDLSDRIEVTGRDELSRLAGSFNTMLGALEESSRAQRQLVADASHELRTPLTSLRTNIEVLASERKLPPGERERLLADVVDQLTEMTTLISEPDRPRAGRAAHAEPEDVRLDLVAADAVERARRNRPQLTFNDRPSSESIVQGVPSTIERAVANLLDNAAKWSPPNGDVEVAVRDGTRERARPRARHRRGRPPSRLRPFLPRRPHVAGRARASDSRSSGRSPIAHGGAVVAEAADGGGTRMTLRLNGSS